MSEDTTLADLLQLNLHKYEDEVRNIVDKAVKESGMEKVPRRRACRASSPPPWPGETPLRAGPRVLCPPLSTAAAATFSTRGSLLP